MGTIQVNFDVPKHIEEGIKSGQFKIIGGVVRNLNGEIVFHLKETGKIIRKMDSRKKLIAGGILVVGTVVVASGTYAVKKIIKKRNKLQKAFDQFNKRFVEYVLSADKMELNIDIVNSLYESSELLKGIVENTKKIDKVEKQLNIKDFNELINSVYEYTLKLAKKNNIKIQNIEKNDRLNIKDNIIDLQKYLDVQREVFEKCA
jgi:hypothetical protein